MAASRVFPGTQPTALAARLPALPRAEDLRRQDDAGVLQTGSIDPNVSGAYATDDDGVDRVWGSDDPFAPGTKGAAVMQVTQAVGAVILAKEAVQFGHTGDGGIV